MRSNSTTVNVKATNKQMRQTMSVVLKGAAEAREEDRADTKRFAKARALRKEAIAKANAAREKDERRPHEDRVRDAIAKVAVDLRQGNSMSQADAERLVRRGVNKGK